MAQPPSQGSVQRGYRSLSVDVGIGLFVGLSLMWTPMFSSTPGAGKAPGESTQEDRQSWQLEPGRSIERELAGGQSHSYQIALAAGQYLQLVVDQQGIDLVLKMVGPGGQPGTQGNQTWEFDSEVRTSGQETVEQVAEVAGSYRLNVQAKQKNAPAGRYKIQVVEVRGATERDRSLQEARQLYEKYLKMQRAGKYDDAIPLVERALEIREGLLGTDHRDVAAAINALASLYHYKGDYSKAEPLYSQALAIREKTLGAEHPDVTQSLTNLASLYKDKGEYVKAEPLYQRVLEIRERTLGPDHPNVAASLNTLALLYSYRGESAKAEPLYQRALEIRERTLGPEHLDVAASLNNLALLYQYRGESGKAEPLYRRALEIREKALGPDHPDVAATLNNLALFYSYKADYDAAEPLFLRALASRERAMGPEHPRVAAILNDLALLYHYKGEYARAEPFYQRALAIREKSLGPEHPAVTRSLYNLATLYAAKGDMAQAIAFQSRACALGERNLALNLTIGSERQKLAYLALFSTQTDFTLTLHARLAPNDPQALNLAFTTLLRRKGRGLDAMVDTIAALRRHAAPQDQSLLDQLSEARSQLAAVTLKVSGAAKPDTYRTSLKPLEEKVEKLEDQLSSRSIEFRTQTQPVSLGAVQSALPAGVALIEFALYTPQDPRAGKVRLPRYVAYVLAAQGPPRWVDLGGAAAIDRAIEAWRKALRDPDRLDFKRLARAVDEKVMRPVRALLQSGMGDVRRLLVAPDGLLNLVPFVALVDERDRYLVERYSISYLTSGRDLLRLQTRQPSMSAALLLANPDFGRASTIATQATAGSGESEANHQGRGKLDTTQVFFQPLPGTQGEAVAIKSVLPEAVMLLREQATEAAIKQARAPRILHIATHGFFLDDQEAPPPQTRGIAGEESASDLRLSRWAAHVENPLLRSGLALAGANQGQNGDDDGVLTALEAAGLDLWGTKLVVLSACDTGVGELKKGEGVQGLRRALVLAGSESQVMSLWPVPDETTKDLMIPYYEALQRGEGRGEALRQVQLRMLQSKDRRHPFHWAAFIQSGEWGNLEGQR